MATENELEQKAYSLDEVKSVFEQLSEAKKAEEMQAIEQAKLQALIVDIQEKVTSLEKADAENKEIVEALHQAISDKEADLEKAGEEKAKLQQQLEETQGKLEAAEQKLAEAAERELLATRIQVLTDKEILRANEEAQVKQIEKVKVMSEEEFAAYVEDLEDIKNQFLSTKQVEEKASDEETKEASKKEDITKMEKVAEQLAEEVASVSEDGGEEASKLIKELIAKAKGKSLSRSASSNEVSPQNFESAATLRPSNTGNRFAVLGEGLSERLFKK